MSSRPYSSVTAVQARMVVISLAVAGAIGAVAAAFGYISSVLTVVLATALICSLFCAVILQRLMKEIRSEQIFGVQDTLKLAMYNWSVGDEKEAAQVRDAVTAMELLNSAFAAGSFPLIFPSTCGRVTAVSINKGVPS